MFQFLPKSFKFAARCTSAIARRQKRGCEFQNLEARTLMSAVPLTVTTLGTALGTELRITGKTGNDAITLKQRSTGLVVTTGTGWNMTFKGKYADVRIDGGAGNDVITIDSTVKVNCVILGGAGNDQIVDKGSGADSLYGGAGKNTLTAGTGSDTLVSINGAADTLTGGKGLDSFWADSTGDVIKNITATETANGTIHKVAKFMTVKVNGTTKSVSKTGSAGSIAEPTLADYATGYADFSSKPLFAAGGPSENDINQGAVGDCYFLSTLSSIAKLDPQLIRQSIVSLGDGTYAVQFFSGPGGAKTYVRIDGKLPTTSWGGLAYDSTGTQSDIWAALMEKAWTYYRSNQGSYASIDAGFMSEAYNALGLDNHSIFSAASSSDLLNQIKTELAAGHSVTFATDHDEANLIGGHAYTVDHVVTDTHGNVTSIVMRNPWGVDGAGTDGHDDGFVTVAPSVAFEDFSFATFGNSKWSVSRTRTSTTPSGGTVAPRPVVTPDTFGKNAVR